MASAATVFRVLNTIAGAYNWSPDRIERQKETWLKFLAPIDDDKLVQAGDDWIRSEEKAPSINDLLKMTRQGGGPDIQGCPECAGTGWRQLAWWKNTPGGNVVTTYAAACSCQRGNHMRKTPGVLGFQEATDLWKQDPSTIEVFCSDSRGPLTHEQCYVTSCVSKTAEMPPVYEPDRF